MTEATAEDEGVYKCVAHHTAQTNSLGKSERQQLCGGLGNRHDVHVVRVAHALQSLLPLFSGIERRVSVCGAPRDYVIRDESYGEIGRRFEGDV